MGAGGKRAALIQNLLGDEQPFQRCFHGKTGEFPLNDPGEPYQGAHIEKAEGGEGFFPLEDMKTRTLEFFADFIQILLRIGKGQFTQ